MKRRHFLKGTLGAIGGGALAACAGPEGTRVWDLDADEPRWTGAPGRALAIGRDILATGGQREPYRVYRLDTGEMLHEYAYLSGLTRPISENRFYKRWLRPWIRRRFAPDHLK